MLENKLPEPRRHSRYYSTSLSPFRVRLLINCVFIAAIFSYLIHSSTHYNLVSSPNIPPRVVRSLMLSLLLIQKTFSVFISLMTPSMWSLLLDFLGSRTSGLALPPTSLPAPILSLFLAHSPPPFIKCRISSSLSPRCSSHCVYYLQEIITSYDFNDPLHVSENQLISPAQTASLLPRPTCPTTYYISIWKAFLINMSKAKFMIFPSKSAPLPLYTISQGMVP